MRVRKFLAAVGCVGLIAGALAVAKPGNGKAQAKSGLKAGKGVERRTVARVGSQGPIHASPRALSRANLNSVLRSGTVVAGPFTGLGVGALVTDANGIPVGTVERILLKKSGAVHKVLARSSSGRIVPLPASRLSWTGSTLVAVSLLPGNGR